MDLFSHYAKSEADIVTSYDVEVPPTNVITGNNPIRFVLPGHPEHFLDLSNTYMRVRFKVIKKDGSPIEDLVMTENVQTVNCPAEAMFESMQVKLNQQLVGGHGNYHPFISHLKNMLTNSTKGSRFARKMSGFAVPSYRSYAIDNRSYISGLAELISKSRTATLYPRLALNALMCPRLVLPNVEFELLTNKCSRYFFLSQLESDLATYDYILLEATLIMRRVNVERDVASRILSKLAHQPALYPYCRIKASTVEISQGSSYFRAPNMFQAIVPNRLFIAFTETVSVMPDGSMTNDPFHWSAPKYNLKKVRVLPRCFGSS